MKALDDLTFDNRFARLGDALPGAAVPWPATPVALALVVGGCALAIVIVPWLLARPWWCLGLAVVAPWLAVFVFEVRGHRQIARRLDEHGITTAHD